MKPIVSQLFVYPIKSFAGISVESHKIDKRGFVLDRRWMLIDRNNNFVSQRTLPEMALVTTAIENNKILLAHKTKSEFHLELIIDKHSDKLVEATLFDKRTKGFVVSDSINKELSMLFGKELRLIYMSDNIKRFSNKKYAHHNTIISYADGFPFLLLGEKSLNELNNRLTQPVEISRFRPNIVFDAPSPFIEDKWKEIKISNILFHVVKPCSRCVIVTIDQSTAQKNNEVLTVLSEFRREGNKVNFGQNMLHASAGELSVGNRIEVLI